MPSFDAQRLLAMAQQLQLAQSRQDWERLRKLDLQVQVWVKAAQAEGFPMELLNQWQELMVAHQQALHACSLARQQAELELRNLQHSQEAQKAYAWQEILE